MRSANNPIQSLKILEEKRESRNQQAVPAKRQTHTNTEG